MNNLIQLLASLFFLVLLTCATTFSAEVVIVTSFPKDLFDTYQTEFEAKHQDIKLVFRSKKTSAAVTYIRETATKPNSDIFWASAVDAFALLKKEDLLARYTPPEELLDQTAKTIGDYPIHDPDSYFFGFALSGYGMMWNNEYMQAYQLPFPEEWIDLTKPIYHNHLSMCSPSRSGTTHLTVESILQGHGWQKGWALLLQMAGNMTVITERSFGVPQGIASGEFGIGVVVDFFGLSAISSGQPVGFVYPSITPMVPANIALIKGSPNTNAAQKFIDFVISRTGQNLLFTDSISRLPIIPDLYDQAPDGFPNPFQTKKSVPFDADLSQRRYEVLNSLFDWFITFRLQELQRAWKAIYKAEEKLDKKRSRGKNVEQIEAKLDEAKQLVSRLPINENLVSSIEFSQNWSESSNKYQQKWDQQAKSNYNLAKKIAKSIK